MNRKRKWQIPPPSEPVTDEYLTSVTIGERKPLNDRIQLAEYDLRWPSMFSVAADKIRSALSEKALLVEHVGSTSVPGLAAKPIIDMLLGVTDQRTKSPMFYRLNNRDLCCGRASLAGMSTAFFG